MKSGECSGCTHRNVDEQRKYNMNYKGEFKNWQIYSMPIIFSCCSKLQDIEINNGIYPIQPLLNVVKVGEGKISFQLSI